MSTSVGFCIAGCMLLVLLLPETSLAQSGSMIRGYAAVGSISLAAADSFDAVAGTNRVRTIGGGIAVTPWKSLFLDVAISRVKVDGERVFVDQGVVYRLNIPLQVTLIPLDVAGGWRRRGRVAPYAAVGLTRIWYNERSDLDAAGEGVDDGGTGVFALAGVDVPLSGMVHVGGEVRYRHLGGLLGQTGVSQVFGERSVGGVATSVRLSIGR